MKYIIFSFFYLLSLLPLKLLYLFSSLTSFILSDIFKYRKKIIIQNLQTCFPEKSSAEREIIMRNYYRNFGEVLVETIKLLSISPKTLKKMMFVKEDKDWEEFLSEDKTVMLYFAHRGNFEIGSQCLPFIMNKKLFGAYKPFKTQWVEWLWRKVRNRFNTHPVAVKNIVRTIFHNESSDIVYGFLNDQSPTLGDQHLWVKFFDRDTLFFTGPEKLARKFKNPVYFADLKRIKRGQYQGSVKLLSKKPFEHEEGFLTERYANELERAICEQPDNWLWSHKRWKHIKNN